MIRTAIVHLTAIPAVAYRQKLPDGGSGIVIVRGDVSQPGIASVSKTSGEAIPTANTPADQYPGAAFAEALALTAGMPYRKLGAVKYAGSKPEEVPEEAPEPLPEYVVVDTSDYEAVISAYTDKNDKISYDLLNRDMIKLAHSSRVVADMVGEMKPEDEIRRYVVGTKFRELTGNPELTDDQVQKILDLLDDASPRGVLKEFKEEIRRKLAESKRK